MRVIYTILICLFIGLILKNMGLGIALSIFFGCLAWATPAKGDAQQPSDTKDDQA